MAYGSRQGNIHFDMLTTRSSCASELRHSVDYLVSEDKDLTAKDAATAQLRQRLRVLLCGTFLREVMGWSSEELERVRGRNWADL